jgi:hypothetical protein
MILGWLAITKHNGITASNHKTSWMQCSNHLGDSRVVRLYVINLIRHGRVQHTQQCIRNLPSRRRCATIAGWSKDKNSSDNYEQKHNTAPEQKEFANRFHGRVSISSTIPFGDPAPMTTGMP